MSVSSTSLTTSTLNAKIESPAAQLIARAGFYSSLLLVSALLIYLIPVSMHHYRESFKAASVESTPPDLYAGILTFLRTTVAAGYLIVGWLIFTKKSGERLAVIVGVSLVSFASILSFIEYSPDPLGQIDSNIMWAIYAVYSSLGYILFPWFLAIFPDGRFRPRWMWVVVGSVCVLTITIYLPDDSPVNFLNWSRAVIYLSAAVIILAGAYAQIHRYRNVSTPIQRQQTKWVVAGFTTQSVLWVGAYIFDLSLGLDDRALVVESVYAIIDFLSILLPFTLLIAVMRYRLWDIDFVINRTLVLIGLAIFLAFDFVLILFVSQYAVSVIAGDQYLPFSIAISALFAGVAYNPTRQAIQHFIDHHLYHFRFDMNQLHEAHVAGHETSQGFLSGQTVGGYKLQMLLGEGGMGEVYMGIDGQEIVAVKVLRTSEMDGINKRRFEREARTGMSLDHPNIAHVREYAITGTVHYMVMEYVDGVDLGTLIRRGETFSPIQILRWVDDICRALEVAHQAGIIHRDIKPSNIMIRHDKSAVLTDFGVSKWVHDETDLTGAAAVGTIYYMAPEQIEDNKTIDHRVDIYALSIVIFELLTLQRPFQGTVGQVLFAHVRQPPPDPRTLFADIAEHVALAVMRGMAKNPEKRFTSANELALAMQGNLPQQSEN